MAFYDDPMASLFSMGAMGAGAPIGPWSPPDTPAPQQAAPAPVPPPAPGTPDPTLAAMQAAMGGAGLNPNMLSPPPGAPQVSSGAMQAAADGAGMVPGGRGSTPSFPGLPPGLFDAAQAAQPPQSAPDPSSSPPAAPQQAPQQDRYDTILSSLVNGESGGDPNAKNPKSTASGLLQLTDGTFGDFIKSPANTAGYTEANKGDPAAQWAAGRWNLMRNEAQLAQATGQPPSDDLLKASHLLGAGGAAALARNPDAPISALLPADVISKNSSVLSPTMTGNQALQAIPAFYAGSRGAGGGSSPQAGMAAGDQTGPQGPQGGPPIQPMAITPENIRSILNSFQPSTAEKLRAIGAGLLAGPNFGAGLSKGLQNMQGLTTGNQELALKAAGAISQANYHNSILANQTQKIAQGNVMPVTTMGPNGPQVSFIQKTGPGGVPSGPVQLPGMTAQQINATNGTQRVGIQQKNLDSRLSGAATQASATGKAAADDLSQLSNTTGSDAQSLNDLQETMKLIQSNPQMLGPTLLSRAQRALGQMGITDGSTALGDLQKMQADARMAYLQRATGGHVGGIRSNAELQNLSQAVANLGTDPEAAKVITSFQLNQLMAKQAWRQEVAARMQQDPSSMVGQNYFNNKSKFEEDYFNAHPFVRVNPDGTMATAAPQPQQPAQGQAQQSSSGPLQGTYKGIKWSFTPGQ